MNVRSSKDPQRDDREGPEIDVEALEAIVERLNAIEGRVRQVEMERAGWTKVGPNLWTGPLGTIGSPGDKADGQADGQITVPAGTAYMISGERTIGTPFTFVGHTTAETMIRYTEDEAAETRAHHDLLRAGLRGGVTRSAVSAGESGLLLAPVTVRLEPCPVCRAGLRVVNGRIMGPHRVWSEGGILAVTAHFTEDCPGRLRIPVGAVEMPDGVQLGPVSVVPAPVGAELCPERHPNDGRQCNRPVGHYGNRHRATLVEGRRTDADRWETPVVDGDGKAPGTGSAPS